MKNKRSIYILLPAALLLWAYIIYKIVAETDSKIVVNTSTASSVKQSGNSAVPADYELLLNYRDPFLGNKIKEPQPVSTVPIVPRPVKTTPPPPVVKNVKWPSIQYSGQISNKKAAKEVHMLVIGGSEYLVSAGQTVQGITITAITADSIKMEFEGDRKSISKR